MTRWSNLRTGDWIVCPTSGLPERVTFSRRGGSGVWMVRTDHHDHVRPATGTVEKAEAPS